MKTRMLAALALILTAAACRAETLVSDTVATTTWVAAASPYRVVGPTTVLAGDTLEIEPGVDVLFDVDVPLVIEGALHARGTAADSVRFLAGNALEWGGIRLTGDDSSSLAFARVGGAHGDQPYPDEYGGGVFVQGRLTMNDCVIGGNRSETAGGGLYATASAVVMTDCIVRSNTTAGYGGGVRAFGETTTLTMIGCVLEGNSARGGGGLETRGATVRMEGCSLTANTATGYGGGIMGMNGGTTTLTNCFVTGNNAPSAGGGLSLSSQSISLIGCTVSGNSATDGGGINISHCTVTLRNSIVWGNSSRQLLEGESGFPNTLAIEYSCLQGDWPGEGNVDVDPLFSDPAEGDYALLPNSPCIDAGDPSLTDPDGSRSDMGAIPFTHPVSVATDRALAFDLRQNLPNPFNPVTTIPYAIAEAGPVTLSVYNLQGQLVRTLVQEIAEPGEHHTVWDGRDFAGRAAASGAYLCRLVAPEGVRTMRMTLVR